MKQKQHSTEEIIRILRQAETDATIDSICRAHNSIFSLFCISDPLVCYVIYWGHTL